MEICNNCPLITMESSYRGSQCDFEMMLRMAHEDQSPGNRVNADGHASIQTAMVIQSAVQ